MHLFWKSCCPPGQSPACTVAGVYSPVQDFLCWLLWGACLPILAFLGLLWMAILSWSILLVSPNLVLSTDLMGVHPSSGFNAAYCLQFQEKQGTRDLKALMVWAYLHLRISTDSRQAWISVKLFLNISVHWTHSKTQVLYSYNLFFFFFSVLE